MNVGSKKKTKSHSFVDSPGVGNFFPFNFLIIVFLATGLFLYHRIIPLSIPTFICHRGLTLPFEPTFKTAKVTSY